MKELWIYRWNQLFIYQFNGQQYQESQTSLQVPEINVKMLVPEYANRGWQIGSSISLREFEQFLNSSEFYSSSHDG